MEVHGNTSQQGRLQRRRWSGMGRRHRGVIVGYMMKWVREKNVSFRMFQER